MAKSALDFLEPRYNNVRCVCVHVCIQTHTSA